MFNTTQMMQRAHEIRRAGYSMSEALKKAWAEARISRIDDQLLLWI